MSLTTFESLLAHPAPGFACYDNEDSRKAEGLLAPVCHRANAGAKKQDLEKIPDVVGSEAARQFYASHDGALLYTGPGLMLTMGGPEEGLEVFPIKEWESRTKEVVDEMRQWGLHGYKRMPYGPEDFIAFAHSRGAFNYVHWVIRGPRAGSVYWWAWTMPPDKKTPPMASDFASFIELICTQPIHFFNELLFCYTRFSDGKTAKQWIPSRYLLDRREFKLP